MFEAAGSLVEREIEIALLVEAVDRAQEGDGGVVSVQGAAGIGKTALLDTAVDLAARRGMSVFAAVANELEQDFPFVIARQLFERPLLGAGEERRLRLLSGAARLAGPALGIAGAIGGQADSTFGALHGLYWLVANLSVERPLLLAVDDVQWADQRSLRFLAYLARRLEDLPALLVTTWRTGEPEAEPRLLAELAAGPGATVIAPAPLSEAGAAQLLDALDDVPAAPLVARLHAETGGNPFLLRELARGDLGTAEVAAPLAVERSILARLRRLGPEAIALATAVALLGDGCSPDEAAALARLSPEDAAEATAALTRGGFVSHDDLLRFVHPVVRAVVVDRQTPAERAIWHGRAARLLMRREAARDRIVAQLLLAVPEEDADAAALLHEAGRDALAAGAPATAARDLRRALQSTPAEARSATLLGDLGIALMLSDELEEAVSVLRRARALADDPEVVADHTLALWRALLSLGRVEEGVGVLEETIAALGEEHREPVLMLEGEFVTAALFDPGRLDETWRRLGRFESLAGDTPGERRLLSMLTAKSQYEVANAAPDLAAIARRAYAGGKLIAENPLDSSKWIWTVGALIATDNVRESEEALATAFAVARTTGSLETLIMAQNLRGWLALRLGRLEDAEADSLEGLERLREIEATPLRDLLRLVMVRWAIGAMVDRGRLDAAERLLAEHGLDGEIGGGAQHAKLRRERSQLRLAQGRPDEALAEAEEIAAVHRRHGFEDAAEAPWRPLAALALVDLGDPDRAAQLADEHLALVRRWDLPRDVAGALRVRALAEQRLERREQILVEALTTLADAPAPLERAEAETALGRTLLRAGRRTEAKEVLGRALDTATRCGATVLAARALDELRVAGARPRRAMVSGVEALTAAERRTAELAADGLSNREIAQTLFLSVRTVENTLARAYRKLGIGSRRELVDALSVTPGQA